MIDYTEYSNAQEALLQIEKQKDREAQETAQSLHREEISRRRWCIEQAVCLDAISFQNVLVIADKIYDYVYGVNDAK